MAIPAGTIVDDTLPLAPVLVVAATIFASTLIPGDLLVGLPLVVSSQLPAPTISSKVYKPFAITLRHDDKSSIIMKTSTALTGIIFNRE